MMLTQFVKSTRYVHVSCLSTVTLPGSLFLILSTCSLPLGEGVFPAKDFAKGDFLLEYRGRHFEHLAVITSLFGLVQVVFSFSQNGYLFLVTFDYILYIYLFRRVNR